MLKLSSTAEEEMLSMLQTRRKLRKAKIEESERESIAIVAKIQAEAIKADEEEKSAALEKLREQARLALTPTNIRAREEKMKKIDEKIARKELERQRTLDQKRKQHRQQQSRQSAGM
eukprot:TRINITY_DN2855_c0_g1_i6.p1 TRINITY_DN2855_c0_g1~~TRINITY_DN2855_c0_g1_i6.p1  ORF type:complete len:117 (-),score=39.84 TRINITY_DN2855_c0_g1_i6:495-845(-)